MKEVLMMKGTRTLIETCANATKGEKILIITDPERINIAKLLIAVLAERDIKPVTMIMFPNDLDGQEPPALVSRAMLGADLIIMPVSKSISHSTAVKNALESGARVLSLSAFTEEQMYIGGINADFRKQKVECDIFANYFNKSDRIKITSPAGMNFNANIKGRPGNSHSCIVNKAGDYSAVPNIEANISPIEGESDGIIIADGSVPNFGIGVVKTPVKFLVKKGVITEITGGREAKFIDKLLRSVNNPSVYNIAQIAIGLNPECKDFNGIMLNDHGVYGSAHIGIGTSHNLGGGVKAPIHFDVTIANPTIYFDGKIAIKEGIIIKDFS